MSERTPPMSAIRSAWAKAHPFPLTTDVDERYAEFDRALAAHDAEVRAGVVVEEPEWEYGVIGQTGHVVNNGDYTREQKLRRRKAGPWVSGCFGHCDPEGWFTPCRVPVKQEGAER